MNAESLVESGRFNPITGENDFSEAGEDSLNQGFAFQMIYVVGW